MRSPPARARADYFFKDHKPSALQGEARLRVTRTPTVTLSTIGYRLSAIGYRLRSALGSPGRSPPARHANSNGDPIDHRLSAIGYRLSAIGYDQPSALQGEARPRGLYRIMYSKTIIAWFPWWVVRDGSRSWWRGARLYQIVGITRRSIMSSTGDDSRSTAFARRTFSACIAASQWCRPLNASWSSG